MLNEFISWFSTKTPYQQKLLLLKLEEVFHIQNNFGYIESLKDQIKSLISENFKLKNSIELSWFLFMGLLGIWLFRSRY